MSELINLPQIPRSLTENISELSRDNELFLTPDELLELPVGEIFKSPITATGYTGGINKNTITKELSYGLDITRNRIMQAGTVYKIIFKGMPSEIEYMSSPGTRGIGKIELPVTLFRHWTFPKGKVLAGPKSESPIGFFDLSLDPTISELASHIASTPIQGPER
jgi:hypothetical protein